LLRQRSVALAWFTNPFPTGKTAKPLSDYTPDELAHLEADQQGVLLKAEAALGLPVLQPLSFKRSMRPGGSVDAFTLLHESETGAYVLAMVIHGRKRRGTSAIAKKNSADSTETIKHFQPKVGENLRFFSFPDKPFVPPKRTSVLMFSLKYGQDYHEQRFLDLALARLRANQSNAADALAVERTADVRQEEQYDVEVTTARDMSAQQATKKASRSPRALIGSARITCWWSEKGEPRFFAHLPIPLPVPTRTTIPMTVVGIHEHRDGYSYAVLSLDGAVLVVGDLEINPDVLPREEDTVYNPNYAAEVATAIVRLAENIIPTLVFRIPHICGRLAFHVFRIARFLAGLRRRFATSLNIKRPLTKGIPYCPHARLMIYRKGAIVADAGSGCPKGTKAFGALSMWNARSARYGSR
jgi:hypothetical protein